MIQIKRMYSLKKNKEFAFAYRRGRAVSSDLLTLIYVRRGKDITRAGFAVGKKVGKAVVRNKVKRRLREAYTRVLAEVKPGYSLVFVAKGPTAQAEFCELEKALNLLLRRSALLGQ